MKKIIITVLSIIVVIFLGIFGYLAVNADSIIAKYKPDMERAASDALGTKVSLGNLSVSVFPRVKVRVDQLSVSQSPDGPKFKEFFLNLSLLKLLFGEINIANLEIHEPSVALVKSGDNIEVVGLPKKEAQLVEASSGQSKSPSNTPSELPVKIGLDAIEVKNASLTFTDSAAGKTYQVQNVNLKAGVLLNKSDVSVKDMSLTGSVHIPADERTGDGPINLDFNGSGNVIDSKIDLELQLLSSEIKFGSFASPISGIDGTIKVGGNIKEKIFTVRSDSFSLNLGPSPIKLTFDASQVGDELNVNNANLNAFSGTVNLKAKLNNISKNLESTINISTINLGELIATAVPGNQPVFQGTLESLSLDISGAMGDSLKQSLRGSGNILLKDGKMMGSNLAGEVLKAISSLPSSSGSLFANIPPEDQQKLSSNDTEIKSLSASFSIADQRITTPDFSLISGVFSMLASGTAGFDSSADLKCKMSFDKIFSTAIVAKVKELQGSVDSDGRLTIPLTLKGKAPSFVVMPDLHELLSAGLKDKASKALGDLLSGKKDASGQSSGKKDLKKLFGF